jgi:Domain of unknown function (DUF5069)
LGIKLVTFASVKRGLLPDGITEVSDAISAVGVLKLVQLNIIKTPYGYRKKRDQYGCNNALAKDLTKNYPRSPRETLAGYVIAAPTLDKCRATLAGTAGEYHFDCPLDNFFFAFSGISAEDFKKFVATGASDEEVANWIEETAKKRQRIEVIK